MYSFPSFSQVSNRSHLNFTAAFHHAPFLAPIFRQDLFENPPKSWKSPGLRIAKGQKKGLVGGRTKFWWFKNLTKQVLVIGDHFSSQHNQLRNGTRSKQKHTWDHQAVAHHKHCQISDPLPSATLPLWDQVFRGRAADVQALQGDGTIFPAFVSAPVKKWLWKISRQDPEEFFRWNRSVVHCCEPTVVMVKVGQNKVVVTVSRRPAMVPPTMDC